MRITLDRGIPPQIPNIYSLGKLFNKKYQAQEYCTLLKHFIENDKGQTQSKNRKSKRRSTRRQVVAKNILKTQTNYNNVDPVIISNSKQHIRTLSPRRLSKPRVTQKIDLRKEWSQPLSPPPQPPANSRFSRLIREQKEFICYSKKGRLLQPNKHCVVADGNVFVIAQGCGKQGDEISTFIAGFLLKSTKYLFSLEEFQSSKPQNFDRVKLREYFKEMFQSANFELSISNIDIRRSGCIASIVYMYQGRAIIASTKYPNVLLVSKTNCRFLDHTKSEKSININAQRPNQEQTKKKESQESMRKREKQQQHFEGFGNIYSQNCTCPVEMSVHLHNQSEFLMLGSTSLFTTMSMQEINQALLSNPDLSPVNRVKQLLESASKRMKTINHQDLSCILVKCNSFK